MAITNVTKQLHVDRVLAEIKYQLTSDDTVSLVENSRWQDFCINGQSCSFDLREEYNRSTWHSKPTGKLRLSFTDVGRGKYGSTTVNLPQRKDGTFDYPRVAAAMIRRARREAALQQAEAARRDHLPGVKAFCEHHSLDDYFGEITVRPSQSDLPCAVKVEFSRTLGYADAEALINGLRALGVAPRKQPV